MLLNLPTPKLTRPTTIHAVAVIILFVLSIFHPQSAPAKQLVNQYLPEILENMAKRLPSNWQPQRMQNGEVHLHNPAHRLDARINQDGIHIVADAGLFFNMRLVRFGFIGALKTAKSERAQIVGVRVDISHGLGLTEWFINTPVGIEQGFHLIRAPQEQAIDDRRKTPREFEMHFKLSGNLMPELNAAGLSFKDKSGRRRLHYNQLLAYDAAGLTLPANLALEGENLKISVDVSGARYPIVIDPVFSSQLALSASDADANDQFGTTVAVDGDTVVVGAPFAAVGLASEAGAVYVFTRNPSTGLFNQQQILTAADADADDRFGSAVYADGHTIVIGAPRADVGLAGEAGVAYVFTRDPTKATNPWTQQQEISAADAEADDRFGSAVFLQGNSVIIGAPLSDSGTSDDTGAAYIFTRNPSSAINPWIQQQKLNGSDSDFDDQFGFSVGLEGNSAVVAAPLADLTGATDAGAIYVFTRDQSKSANPWGQQQKLIASDAGSDDRFGRSIFMDGNTILVGAPRADTTGATDAGAVYVFTRDLTSGNFVENQILNASTPGSNNQFGTSVYFDGGSAVIGAPLANVATASDAGRAILFSRNPNSGNWRQQQVLTTSNPQALSQFGGAVSFNAVTAVIGAKLRDQGTLNDAGVVFVFILEPENDEISQETDKLSAADAEADDNLGSAVGLSADTSIFGAPNADPDAFLNAGVASAFSRDPASQLFDQEVALKASDRAAQDNFGDAVSIDGDTAVIGAPNVNLPGENDAGAAYIFSHNPNSGIWSQIDKLTADDAVMGDRFGSSAAIDADITIMGAPFHNPNGSPSAGAAYVFSRNPAELALNQWSQTVKLTAEGDAAMDDQFGTSVALNGDTALVGAPFADVGGAVFVFVRDPSDNSWSRQQKLTAADAGVGDRFGFSAFINGNTAIIGAPLADGNGILTAGAVYIFTRDPTVATNPWSQRVKLAAVDAATGDAFGTSVGLAGNTAIIGAPGADLAGTGFIVLTNAGAAYDFRRDPDTGQFSQRSKLTASDAAAFDAFGDSVIVTCDTFIIGAPMADLLGPGMMVLDNAGAAFIFQTFPLSADPSDGAGSAGSLKCFIDTASSGSLFNLALTLLGPCIAAFAVGIWRVWRKRRLGDRQPWNQMDRC